LARRSTTPSGVAMVLPFLVVPWPLVEPEPSLLAPPPGVSPDLVEPVPSLLVALGGSFPVLVGRSDVCAGAVVSLSSHAARASVISRPPHQACRSFVIAVPRFGSCPSFRLARHYLTAVKRGLPGNLRANPCLSGTAGGRSSQARRFSGFCRPVAGEPRPPR